MHLFLLSLFILPEIIRIRMKKRALNIFSYVKQVLKEFSADNIFKYSASLAYYTVFSLAPLLAIVLSIAGIFYGYDAVQGRMFHELNGLVGSDGAQTIQSMVASARKPATSILMTVVCVALILFGASGRRSPRIRQARRWPPAGQSISRLGLSP